MNYTATEKYVKRQDPSDWRLDKTTRLVLIERGRPCEARAGKRGPEMRFLMAIAILLVVLAAVFALQNSQPVSVSFFNWSFSASLVIVLILAFAVGALSAFLFSIPWRVKVLRELSALRKLQKTGVEER